jgi:hypothetical protein
VNGAGSYAAAKVLTLVAGMVAGADSIDDMAVGEPAQERTPMDWWTSSAQPWAVCWSRRRPHRSILPAPGDWSGRPVTRARATTSP